MALLDGCPTRKIGLERARSSHPLAKVLVQKYDVMAAGPDLTNQVLGQVPG
ncbi:MULTISPECIES: hypothetical protein [unclassified Mesorhizobium]|uniref:hypothetical protein n=1 Tax=unclassified Mesorhizobium TaxID=325217 RepID=UPI001672FCC2|nr:MULTISPECIES: hypothetical protein [unclassified Mesorhizobium]